MTSQLILGNGEGVVIASDSATTINSRRVYESTDKVHELPAPHCLAVMHCGRGLRHKMPIGVLVKAWIRSLSDEPEESVEDYRNDFVSWFGNKVDRWQSALTRDAEAWRFLLDQVDELAKGVQWNLGRAEEGESPTEVVLGALRGANEMLARHDQIVSSATAESIIARWLEPDNTLEPPRPSLDESVRNLLGDIPRSETIDEEIQTFLRLVVEKGIEFPDGGWTTLNFVGFGANDLLPTVSWVDLGGSMEKTVWHRSPESRKPGQWGSSYALIYSEAQDDAIRLILSGWDPALSRKATDMAIDNLYASGKFAPPDQEPEGQGAPRESGLGSSKAEIIEAVQTAYDDLSYDKWIDKTYKTVAVMPLLDLAAAAKALVAVQALVLDIRGQLPSVGGHIDVATITVNDGFRWISRAEND